MSKRQAVLLLLLLFAQPAYAGLVLNDTFTESVNMDLDDHTSDSGHTWTLSAASNFRVDEATDITRRNSAGAGRATSSANMGTPDIVCDATVSVSAGGEGGIFVREASATTSATHYFAALYDDGAGNADFYIESRGGGALSTPLDFNGTFGTAYAVRLRVVGSSVIGCVNHTSCVSGTDTGITSGNFVGVYGSGSSLQTIDNLKCYPYSRGKAVQ